MWNQQTSILLIRKKTVGIPATRKMTNIITILFQNSACIVSRSTNLLIILSIQSNSARNINDLVLWNLIKIVTDCSQRYIGKARKRIFLRVISPPNKNIKDASITSI